MKRLRLWRIHRAYRLIVSLEQKVGPAAFVLRTAFAKDSVALIDGMHKAHHIDRTTRRQLKRAVING